MGRITYLKRRSTALYRWHETRLTARHVAGPRRVTLGDNEVAGIIVGRDIAFYLPDLLDHHRALGVRHFVFLDNMSTDGSDAIAAEQPDVTVVRTAVSFRTHQPHMRRLAITGFVEGGWRLVIDGDEMFDYPGRAGLALPTLVERLGRQGRNGVVAQMLDMVPPGRPTADLDESYAAARRVSTGYSLGDITEADYYERPFRYLHSFNPGTHPGIRIKYGGIRRTLFGEDCCLSKHPLFKLRDRDLFRLHAHSVPNVRVADFTALIRHYKFSDGFMARDIRRASRREVSHRESAQRAAVFQRGETVDFAVPGLRRDPTPESLLEDGFLFATPEAREMLAG